MTGRIVGFVLSVSVQQMESTRGRKNHQKTQSHTETATCIQRICAMEECDSEVSILYLNAGATRRPDFMP